jgi:hypothetical protein
MFYDLDSVLTGLTNRYTKFGIKKTGLKRSNPIWMEIEDSRVLAGFIDLSDRRSDSMCRITNRERNSRDLFCKEAFVDGYRDLIYLAGYYTSLGYVWWNITAVGYYMFNVGKGYPTPEYLRFIVRVGGMSRNKIFGLIAYGACRSGNVKLFKLCGKIIVETGYPRSAFSEYKKIALPEDKAMIECIDKFIVGEL